MQQQQQTKNFVIFVVSMALCFAVWYGIKYWMFPPPPLPAPVEARLAAALLSQSDGGFGQGIAQTAALWSVEANHSSARITILGTDRFPAGTTFAIRCVRI